MIFHKKILLFLLVLFSIGIIFFFYTDHADPRATHEVQIEPLFVQSVTMMSAPTFPDRICLLTDYGALVGDIDATTQAFIAAINDCALAGGGRGGIMQDITFKNIVINSTREAESIQLTLDYGSRSLPPRSEELPHISNILFDTITTNTNNPKKKSISVIGIPDHLTGVVFRDISMGGAGTVELENVQGITFDTINAQHYDITDSHRTAIIQDVCPEITSVDTDDTTVNCNK